MPQTSEQAGQVFAQMSPEQVRQYLTQTMVNIGPLQPVDAPMGSADGVRREDMTPTYGNDKVQGLQADGQGGYWGPVTPPFDTQQAGGKYGQYFAKFDVQGNMQPDSLQFSAVERDSGWLSNHLPEVVGTIIVAAGGMAAAQLAGAGAPSATGLASADTGMLGFSGTAAAPITQAGPMTLGAGATVSDIAAAAAAGTPMSQLAPAIANLVKTAGPGVLSALKAIPGLSGIVDQVASTLTGGGGMLNNLLNLGAGTAALTGLKNASNTAADAYGGLADSLKGQYQFLGDKAQGMFTGLGNEGRLAYEQLGTKVGDTYNNLATQTEGQYTNLANKATEQVGKFTPYNITTNVGTTNDKGAFTPTAGAQGISDSATQAAQSSFAAGNAIDVNNLTKQRYDQMQSIFAPGDAESLARIQATEQARGRTGIQSLNPANEFGGVGSNPAMVAYYKAQQDRNLKAQATAADQALAQRGGLLSQGAGAAAVPLNIANQGLQQLSTGAQIGNTAFQNTMAGTQLGTGIEKAGLDRSYDTRMRGADAVTGLFSRGLDYGLTQKGNGINQNLNLSTEGLRASTPYYAQQIGQRYQGNLAATNALFTLLSSIARGSGQAAPRQTGNATDYVSQIANLLKGQGVSDAEIQRIVESQVPPVSYEENVANVNSIWNPLEF